MKKAPAITCVFVDIGGVLLTNGWDHHARRRAVKHFNLDCFVGLRKPDASIFRLALDITQTQPHQVLYIENTAMFVQIAEGLGIESILHKDYKATCAALTALGFES
ncbi:MAG: hypothetical protein M3Y27_24190 [Acidobacteriota bacterium]|nr:hypothetical protein [Acidobacteriota bacterium]